MSNPFQSIKGGRMPQMRAPMVVLDRFGKMVEAGHLVLFHNNEDLVFEVTDVRPILNPAMQASGVQAMQVLLVAQFPIHCESGKISRELAIVGVSQARAAALAAQNGHADPPAAEPPPAEQPASRIVLTDASDPPKAEEADAAPEGPCNNCGWIGPVGGKCPECVEGTFEVPTPTLGDA